MTTRIVDRNRHTERSRDLKTIRPGHHLVAFNHPSVTDLRLGTTVLLGGFSYPGWRYPQFRPVRENPSFKESQNRACAAVLYRVVPTDGFAFVFIGVTGSTGLTVVNPAPTLTQAAVTGEQPVLVRKLNKRGKPIGTPVLSGFMLDFGVPLTPASVSNTGIFQLDTVTTKRVKRKVKTILHPVKKFTVCYVAASNAIEVKLGSAQAFPTSGRLTVLGGVTDRRRQHAERARFVHDLQGWEEHPPVLTRELRAISV